MLYKIIQKNFDRASFFATKSSYDKFIKPKKYYGYENPGNNNDPGRTAQWVMPTQDANQIIEAIKSAKQKKESTRQIYANKLGLKFDNIKNESSFYHIKLNGQAIRIVASELKKTLQFLPNKGTVGANDYWIPGGYTSGGVPELVLNTIPRRKPYLIEEQKISF